MIFKHVKDRTLLASVSPILLMIIGDAATWAYNHGLDFLITATKTTIEEDNSLNRKSSSHREGRAADISVRNWNRNQMGDLFIYLNEKYYEYGALSFSGKINLVVLHDSGYGKHFHIQIHKKFLEKNKTS